MAAHPPSIQQLVQRSTSLCKLKLTELATPCSTTTAQRLPPAASVTDVRNDLVSLLSLIGKECTALSLAFKPPTSTSAVQGTLAKLHALLDKLGFCLGSCPSEGALAREIRWTGEEAFESVQQLLDGSLEAHEATAASASQRKLLRERNLKLTGQVWQVVERAQAISPNELQALRKRWQSTLGLLDDCLDEVKEMQQEPSTPDDGEGAVEEEDDGEDEDEDDFRTSHPLSEDERARVAAAHLLLRLGRLLLNRIINLTAPPEPAPSLSTPGRLAKLDTLVGQLSASADDFALSLEPPQEDSVNVMATFEQVTRSLGDVIFEAVGETEVEVKWVTMWRTQFDRAADKVRELAVA